jgi:hypothetical protein
VCVCGGRDFRINSSTLCVVATNKQTSNIHKTTQKVQKEKEEEKTLKSGTAAAPPRREVTRITLEASARNEAPPKSAVDTDRRDGLRRDVSSGDA